MTRSSVPLAATLLLAALPVTGRGEEAPAAVERSDGGEGAGAKPARPDAERPAQGTAEAARPVYQLHPGADAITVGGAALAISLPSLFAEELITYRCPCDPSTVNRFDRRAIGNHSNAANVASNVTVLAAMIAPPLLDLADVGGGETFASDAAIFAETLLVNGALVEGAKYVFQRPLPLTYAGDPKLIRSSEGYRSFYSGHTSTTFAALMSTAYTIRLRYGEQVWPWIAAAGLGASVGVERVLAGRHFPSDVIVGAVAGSIVGIGVPWLHTTVPGVAIVPAPGGVGVLASF